MDLSTAPQSLPADRAPADARAWLWTGLALLCLFLGNAWRMEADPDLWGHLRFGLESLAAGNLADSDPYSYSAPGAAWTNHEWLTELALAVCYSALGAPGLILLRAFLMAGMLAAIGLLIARRKLSPEATLGVALFGITILAEFYRIRPQMFTYTAFAWLIVLCDGHRVGRRGGLCLIPLLMALWCNFHAGFVAGLGIFGIYWCQFVWEARTHVDRHREWRFLAAILLAAIAATLLNPYGIDYWRYVLYAVTLPRPAITEWGPIWSQNRVVIGCYLAAVAIPAAMWLGSTRRQAPAETVSFALVAFLAAQHGRHLPFVIILGAIVFARRWPAFQSGLKNRLSRNRSPEFLLPARFGLALLMLVAILGGATKLTREVSAATTEGVLTVRAEFYPVAAVSFLKQQRISGNLFCGFSWGEYCLWHLAPRCRIFCDGRYETVYPPEVSRLALCSFDLEEDRRALVEQFPTDILLVPVDQPLADWLARNDSFAEIYRDGVARLFLKRTDRFACFLPAQAARLSPVKPGQALVAFP